MVLDHRYEVAVRWTGAGREGAYDYRGYGRDHVLFAQGKADVLGSAAPAFRGEKDRWNPEELLAGALAQCHMLSYLPVAVAAGITVLAYEDRATAALRVNPDGSGEITEVVLRPVVTITDEARRAEADALHERAASLCFIARSVAFPVRHEPTVRVAARGVEDGAAH